MKANKSTILLILDRSGSMSSMHKDLIGGVNTFIAEQKALPGECDVSVVSFDDLPEDHFWNINIGFVPTFTLKDFVPRNSTALLDAMGYGITSLGERLSALPEQDRPEKVIVIIYTDGEENASKKFDRTKVADLIKQQKDVYSWEFVFLGSNQDAIMTAAKYNIGAGSALSSSYSVSGFSASFSGASFYTSGVRTLGTGWFTEETRTAALTT